ncbi:hypothetical protein CDD82_6252 [Ophiocordyceps australis]|uniref:separase n=1 Tax=Ophiocordyceps australis TaxID=1399860 RepID=A0A2C5ZR87_9HYPO|nr:hypothetical protein CDD82_6252 [Ophiocordyceps australis]
MATLQAKTDAVKAAVASTSTCTATTVVTLKSLLQLQVDSDAKPTASRAGRAKANAETGNKAVKDAKSIRDTKAIKTDAALNSRDQKMLATQVANATLKALTEAATPPTPLAETTTSRPSGDLGQAAARRTMRRSPSLPLSPRPPQTLNRVAMSPSVANKDPKPAHSIGLSNVIECARVAFACLRALQGPPKNDESDFQVEIGMSALIGKLIVLQHHDQAFKELKLMRKRLDAALQIAPTKKAYGAKTSPVDTVTDVVNLLHFPDSLPSKMLPAITACQMQVLKLVAATKKARIGAMLPLLKASNPNSPINLLHRMAQADDSQAKKIARQVAQISQILLALTPSVSSAQDAVALDSRLSPDPSIAFELQTLSFTTQLSWWKLAYDSKDVDQQVLSPFDRCARTFNRRHRLDNETAYNMMAKAFEDIMKLVRSQNLEPKTSMSSPSLSIYRALGSAAHAARQYEEAYSWFHQLMNWLSDSSESQICACCISARLLAASLKCREVNDNIKQHIRDVTTSLEGNFSGTVVELEDLLESLLTVRRSVAGVLMAALGSEATKITTDPEVVQLLNAFILGFPRFLRRWMGASSSKDASAKQVARFDQRRQAVAQSINPVLDSVLRVTKDEIQSRLDQWPLIDDVLQHCIALVQSVVDPAWPAAKTEQFNAYYIKISNLYFLHYTEVRKRPELCEQSNKQQLQALSRSIDTVKERTPGEKNKAQLPVKLGLFADLCKSAGRADDAFKTLISICTNMTEDGILSEAAAALATHPPALAWGLNEKASLLSRTLRSIAKLGPSRTDWTLSLPQVERAAVLEHLIQLRSYAPTSVFLPLGLYDPTLATLLKIYTMERYPVRRVRVLLHVFYQNIGLQGSLDDVSQELDQALQQLERKELAEDSGLSAYIPHLQVCHSSMTALSDENEARLPTTIAKSVASWKAMIGHCKTKADLFAIIDDARGLLQLLGRLKDRAGLIGDYALQESVSGLSITLCKILSGDTLYRDGLILNHSQLAAQYVGMGRYTQALGSLDQIRALVEQHQDFSNGVASEFHLSCAEYYVGIGSFDEATKSLVKIKGGCSQPDLSWTEKRAQTVWREAMTSMLQSTISLHRGDIQEALEAIKTSVRILTHDWARIAAALDHKDEAEAQMPDSSNTSIVSTAPEERVSGPMFWNLASWLLRSLLQLSSVYAHVGMFQETLYFAEHAKKVADNVKSSLFSGVASACIGSIYVKAGRLDKASPFFDMAPDQIPRDAYLVRVRFACQAGEFYWQKGDEQKALGYLNMAEEAIQQLSRCGDEAVVDEAKVVVKAKAKAKVAAPRTTRAVADTRSRRGAVVASTAPRAAPRAAPRRAAATKAKAARPASPAAAMTPKDMHESSLRLAVLLSRALGLVHGKEWSAALALLEEARQMPKHLGTQAKEVLMTATSLIGRSMEQMISDPVFSIMQDSATSLVAVSGSVSQGQPTPPNKSNGRRGRDGGCPAFMEALRRAQEILVDVHGSALPKLESSMVHRISSLLQSTGIFLSATAASKTEPAISSTLTSVAVDLGRNMTWMRELKTIKDRPASDAASSGSMDSMDLALFTHSYVEMLPKNWSVISISLNDTHQDLCINKFQAGHSPFILRLPLERAHSRDVDSEIFNFEHGRQELLDIIRLANQTSHSARERTGRGEREAWRAEREALDLRLKQLLDKVETTWLSGFKGIFAQRQHQPDALKGFHDSFQKILDGFLPSRQRVGGKRSAAKAPSVIKLDDRVLELFVGLAELNEPDGDYDEALTDLLYFVVDILQLHGERNAYDEINFDAIMVQAHKALRAYFDTDSSDHRMEGAHTVLVVDKMLHAFPWESLLCMQGLAVSRVPSLECLRRLLSEAKMPAAVDKQRQGHYVSAKSGTYMLNPSSDLRHTQSYFQPALTTLQGWNNITNRAPDELEFEKILATSDLLLYFGHGSGAQYVRGRTIRRLDRCRPTTFLMGCSSVALIEAGDFECYGPVWNYMMAGCPAVVGTLWDVTDRDIDRFAGRVFEEWGLLPRGTFGGRGHDDAENKSGEEEQDEPDERPALSLVEAVATAREVCRLRYLNAAAVVVYGIPVYIDPAVTDDGEGSDA